MHTYKFLPDGQWEDGANRRLYANREGWMQKPTGLLYEARIERRDRVDVYFRGPVPDPEAVRVWLDPPAVIRGQEWETGHDGRNLLGYAMAGGQVAFCLDEAVYGLTLQEADRVAVVGSFNGWAAGGDRAWWLHRGAEEGVWEGVFPAEGLDGDEAGPARFKFVVNGDRWLEPPLLAPNAVTDRKGHLNLQIDPALSSAPVLHLYTAEPLALSNTYTVIAEGAGGALGMRTVQAGAVLDGLRTRRELGCRPDPAAGTTAFRLFAPRASRVELCLYNGPVLQEPGGGWAEPAEVLPMRHDPADGVWETVVNGPAAGRFYAYRLDGPAGAGDAFHPDVPVSDPYTLAAVHEQSASAVIDPAAPTPWFKGWTDQDWRTPRLEDLVIYEAHVRDLTADTSSGVPDTLRGTFEGLLASEGRGTGLDHLRELGVNMIEFLPIHEFANGITNHGWGYSPVFYFAPESSYGTEPQRLSHVYEFKRLVNELHRRGFGVMLDVVYNHLGEPNLFAMIDSKYYFRLDHEFRYSNFSGCGNDVRSEAPMMRRLIVEIVLYWMREYHVDGFRFDLAELIDLDTLMEIRDEARRLNPNVVLVSEPWSFRGDHKMALRGTGWSSWNNYFRDDIRRFVRGEGDREAVKRAVRGSVDSFAATPLQAVNYLESHDDRCLADELTVNPHHDGRRIHDVDARRNRLAATVLFTSLGVPMLAEGQAYIRSKHGRHNTYNDGDAINALRWNERTRPQAARTLAYYRGLIGLRQSAAGRALRWARAVPEGYIQWIEPADARALGYLVNADGRQPGGWFLVLANAAAEPVEFEVRVPDGRWRWIGDGERIDTHGLPGAGRVREFGAGTYRVQVPAQTAYVYAGTPGEGRREQ